MSRIGDWMQESAHDVRVAAESDVVVVGGGPAGQAAALAAALNGASVTLLERYNHLGGLASGGMVLHNRATGESFVAEVTAVPNAGNVTATLVGDDGTLRSHLAALEAHAPGVLQLYRAAAEREIRLAEERGTLPPAGASPMRSSLASVE